MFLLYVLSVRLTGSGRISFLANTEKYESFELSAYTFVYVDSQDEIEVEVVFSNGDSLDSSNERAKELYSQMDADIYIGATNENTTVDLYYSEMDPSECDSVAAIAPRPISTQPVDEMFCTNHPYLKECVDMCDSDYTLSFCKKVCERAPDESFCGILYDNVDLLIFESNLRSYMNEMFSINFCAKYLQCNEDICSIYNYGHLSACSYYKCHIYIPEVKRKTVSSYHEVHESMHGATWMWNTSTLTWDDDYSTISNYDYESSNIWEVVAVSSLDDNDENWYYNWGETDVKTASFVVSIIIWAALLIVTMFVNNVCTVSDTQEEEKEADE